MRTPNSERPTGGRSPRTIADHFQWGGTAQHGVWSCRHANAINYMKISVIHDYADVFRIISGFDRLIAVEREKQARAMEGSALIDSAPIHFAS